MLGTLKTAGVTHQVVTIATGELGLARTLESLGVLFCLQSKPRRGMLASIQLALEAAAPSRQDTVAICPIDVPALSSSTVGLLFDTVERPGGPGVAVPLHDGRRGHPVVLRGSLAKEIFALDPAIGLRDLFRTHSPEPVRCDDPGTVLDLDTWIDHLQLEELSGPVES